MVTAVQVPWIVRVLRHLPGPLVAKLDRWSHRVAQRHARRRREEWLRRQAGQAAASR